MSRNSAFLPIRNIGARVANPPSMKMTPRTSLKRLWRQWIRPLALTLVVLFSLRSAVADWYVVPTGSMKPTILEGDRILVNKLAYDLKVPFTTWHVLDWSQPQRGDVVVFYSPGSETRMVKRVIGLPGDRLELRGNRLIINGQPVEYWPLDENSAAEFSPYKKSGQVLAKEHLPDHPHHVLTSPELPARRSFGPLVVPENEYFVLGDNRDNSQDSRWFGCVPRDRILGRSSRIVLSLDAANYYIPRWNRFLIQMK